MFGFRSKADHTWHEHALRCSQKRPRLLVALGVGLLGLRLQLLCIDPVYLHVHAQTLCEQVTKDRRKTRQTQRHGIITVTATSKNAFVNARGATLSALLCMSQIHG